MCKLGQTPTSSDNLLILKTSFCPNGLVYKSYNFEARTMFLLRSESLILQILRNAVCDSEMRWEICVDF